MKILRSGEQFRRIESGFTLIEVLIAVLISTMVLGVLFASFFQIIKAKDKVEADLELLHEARVVFSRLNRDLSSAFPRGRIFNSSRRYPYSYFKGAIENENSNLSFSSFSRNPLHFNRESDQAEVSYFLVKSKEEDIDENIYSLVRRDNPWFGNQSGGTEYEISERVVSFKVNYISAKTSQSNTVQLKEGFEEEPISEWNASVLKSFPSAIEVELVLRDEEGEDQAFNSKILIPIAN